MTNRLVACAGLLLLAGCAEMGLGTGPAGPKASATLEPSKGSATQGTVTFVQRGDKVMVSATVSGLKPGGTHGFHIHEKGDCSSGDGMSTGGHFNPAGKPHGHGGQDMQIHAGDMPNLRADQYGNAVENFTLSTVTVGSGPNDVVGKGLIVHANADDYKTQPTGNAGGRIACAVIKAS
jgi:Cu-Zn family superoxide dismutase